MLTPLLSRDFERFLKTELRIKTDLKDERSYEGRACEGVHYCKVIAVALWTLKRPALEYANPTDRE